MSRISNLKKILLLMFWLSNYDKLVLFLFSDSLSIFLRSFLCIEALAIFDVSLLNSQLAPSRRSSRYELLLRLFSLLDVVIDEVLRQVGLLRVILANENRLHAILVEPLQVAAARISLLFGEGVASPGASRRIHLAATRRS